MRREWIVSMTLLSLAAAYFISKDAVVAATYGWLSLLFGVCFLIYVVMSGVKARKLRQGYDVEMDAVSIHRIYVGVLTFSILLGVLGIEIAVRKEGGLWGEMWLRVLHLSFVFFTAVAFVCARVLRTGLRDQKRHRYFAYSFVVCFLITFVTGTMLMELKFPIGVGGVPQSSLP